MFQIPGWPAELRTGDVGLRPHRRSDARAWREVRLANEKWLTPWEVTSVVPWGSRHGAKDYRRMFRAFRRATRQGQIIPFVITYRDAFAGQLTIGNIMRGALNSGAAGYWIDGRVAGRNIMPTALAMAVDFCFRSAALHRVEVNIRPENAASLRVAEKLGFRKEGFHAKYLHIDGAWRDHVGYALTVEDLPATGLLQRWLRSREG